VFAGQSLRIFFNHRASAAVVGVDGGLIVGEVAGQGRFHSRRLALRSMRMVNFFPGFFIHAFPAFLRVVRLPDRLAYRHNISQINLQAFQVPKTLTPARPTAGQECDPKLGSDANSAVLTAGDMSDRVGPIRPFIDCRCVFTSMVTKLGALHVAHNRRLARSIFTLGRKSVFKRRQ